MSQVQISHKPQSELSSINGVTLFLYISVMDRCSAGKAIFKAGAFLPAHVHECWELIYNEGPGVAFVMLGQSFHYFPPGAFAYIPPGEVHAVACGLKKGTKIRWNFPLGSDQLSRRLISGSEQLGNERITTKQQASALWFPKENAPCNAQILYPHSAKPVTEGGVAVNMLEYVNVDSVVSAGNIWYQPEQGIAEHTHGNAAAGIPGHELIYIEGPAQYVTALGTLWKISNGYIYLDCPHSWRCGMWPSIMWWIYFTDRKKAGRVFTNGPDFPALTAVEIAQAQYRELYTQ